MPRIYFLLSSPPLPSSKIRELWNSYEAEFSVYPFYFTVYSITYSNLMRSEEDIFKNSLPEFLLQSAADQSQTLILMQLLLQLLEMCGGSGFQHVNYHWYDPCFQNSHKILGGRSMRTTFQISSFSLKLEGKKGHQHQKENFEQFQTQQHFGFEEFCTHLFHYFQTVYCRVY